MDSADIAHFHHRRNILLGRAELEKKHSGEREQQEQRPWGRNRLGLEGPLWSECREQWQREGIG